MNPPTLEPNAPRDPQRASSEVKKSWAGPWRSGVFRILTAVRPES